MRASIERTLKRMAESIVRRFAPVLQSTGGRAALLGADAHVKIPKITSDWALLEKLANGLPDLRHKPSPAQIAAMVLHLALGRIPEKDLEAATRREFA